MTGPASNGGARYSLVGMTERFRNHGHRHPSHRQLRTVGVPQDVKSRVLDARRAHWTDLMGQPVRPTVQVLK